jgi:acetolactate synthase-1/2/3 large subunit
MVQDSDLIICIGSRFDDRITGKISEFVPEARKAALEGRGGVIHVDIRLTEMAKQVEPTYFVHSTGKNFLRMLNKVYEDQDIVPQTSAWLDHMKELQREYPVKIPRYSSRKIQRKDSRTGDRFWALHTPMSAQHVMSVLNEQLLAAGKMDDAIFTTGVGIHQMVAAQLLTWTKPRQMLSSGSLGTMGVSLGYSIGAKLANGHKIVISIDGDGSFNMTFTELKTVAEQKIPIKIIIFDNESQMMVEYWQKLFHGNRLLAVRNEKNPDYCKLADAFGIKNLYCDSEEDLAEKMHGFLFSDPDEPVLFHVRIERTPCLPLVAPGQRLDSMILEDVDVDVDGASAPS